MELTCINDFKAFLDLRDVWNELLSRSGKDSLFLRHEWLSSWWESYCRTSELQVLLLKKDGVLVAAAPLMRVRGRLRGLPIKKIVFMGESAWTPGDFIIAEQKKEALEAFSEYLLKVEWDVVDLGNISEESDTPAILSGIFQERGLGPLPGRVSSAPFVALDQGWKDFLGKRSLRFRKSMRNKINKMNKAGEVEIKKYSLPDEVEGVLPAIFEIGLKGWKHKINGAISSTEENRSFYAGLGKILSELGWLNIWLLHFNGDPVAFEYHVRYKNRVHGLVADFDEGCKSLSPGSILDFHVMQHLFEEESGEYDMGCGDSFYKRNWTEKSRGYKSVSFSRDTLYGKLLRFMESNIVPLLRTLRDRSRVRKAAGL